MKFIPHEYQKRAMNFMLLNKNCALFLDMGLGKSIITLSAVQRLQEKGKSGSVLIIAPLRVIYSVWQQEAEKWDHTKRLTFSLIHGLHKENVLAKHADIYLINYEGIKSLINVLLKAKKKAGWQPPFNMLVADESSALKAHNTERFKLLKKLLPIFKRRVILTGTPAPNNLMNLWSQFFILDEGIRLEKAFSRFRNRYFEKADYYGYKYNLIKGAAYKIKSKVQDITLRLSSKDYANLPEMIFNPITVNLPEKINNNVYKPLERYFFLQLENGDGVISVANAAVLSLKLRQVVQGGLYTESDILNKNENKDKNKLKHNYINIHDEKINVLKEIIEEAQGQPILIAYQFLFELKKLQKSFGNDLPVIGGMTTGLKAKKIIESWNKGKIQILAAHPSSLSHGVNLQSGGNIIVWLAPTWSLENYLQFNARLHRQGQKKPVIVHHLIAESTIDEAVFKALQNKDKQQSNLLKALEEYRKEKSI